MKEKMIELFHFIFPMYCASCQHELSGAERILCSDCSRKLSFSGYESQDDNPVQRNLGGRIGSEKSAAIFEFRKQGVVQKLLHHLKYDHMPELGYFLGNLAGERIRLTSFASVDFLVPVPIHRKKIKERGYNQSYLLCQGIADIVPKPILETLLLKNESGESQTKRKRLSRWENVKDGFHINPSQVGNTQLYHKHFLLVDDVITTGATLESCASRLLEIPGARVSTLGIATPL